MEINLSYQLNTSSWWEFFHFHLNFGGTLCMQTVESLTRRRRISSGTALFPNVLRKGR